LSRKYLGLSNGYLMGLPAYSHLSRDSSSRQKADWPNKTYYRGTLKKNQCPHKSEV
jgi:hypothetical protein